VSIDAGPSTTTDLTDLANLDHPDDLVVEDDADGDPILLRSDG